MPNWCQNVLIVRGSQDVLTRFRKFARGQRVYRNGPVAQLELCFDRFVPVPEEIRHSTHDADKSLEFRVDNWGTKWEPSDTLFTEEANELTYSFSTAWSPPRGVVLAAAERFATLSLALSYSEIGLGFHGEFVCRGGAIVQDAYENFDPFEGMVRMPGPLVECDLGDAPKHTRFRFGRGNRLFICDGYISDSVVIVPIARLTKPQKLIKQLILRGNGQYQAASVSSARLGWWETPDRVALVDMVAKTENAEPVEPIERIGLTCDGAGSNCDQPTQLLELSTCVGETFKCEAALLAPLIVMAGDGAQVSVRGGRFAFVQDKDGEFVGVAGLWVRSSVE